VIASVDRPVNVLVRPGAPTVAELAELGVSRISVGGGLAFVAIEAVAAAARELRESGTYTFLDRATAGAQAAREAFTS
jgi:2-methylisocitrate lyase-like PEP mutase family enzyme